MSEVNTVSLAIEFLQRSVSRERGFSEVFVKALDKVVEQAERTQTLENSIKKAIEMQEYYLVTNGDLQDENKRLKKALYVALSHAIDSEADGTIDVITNTLQGLDFTEMWDEDYVRGEKLWEEWRK